MFPILIFVILFAVSLYMTLHLAKLLISHGYHKNDRTDWHKTTNAGIFLVTGLWSFTLLVGIGIWGT